MDGVLLALGKMPNGWNRTGLITLLVLWTAGFLIASYAAHKVAGLDPVVFHSLMWIVWLIWLGWIFPSNRDRDLRNASEGAYRRAFYRDVLNGITCSFSQLLRPMVFGFLARPILSPTLWRVGLGLSLLLFGGWLIASGVRTLGITGAMFVVEYHNSPPALVKKGVYRYIRHPLFLGGMMASVGGGLMMHSQESLVMAIINLLILPLYCRLEDKRCIRIFGDGYRDYKSSAGAVFPRG